MIHMMTLIKGAWVVVGISLVGLYVLYVIDHIAQFSFSRLPIVVNTFLSEIVVNLATG